MRPPLRVVLLVVVVLSACLGPARGQGTVEVRRSRGVWSFASPTSVGSLEAAVAIIRVNLTSAGLLAAPPGGQGGSRWDGLTRLRCGHRVVESADLPGLSSSSSSSSGVHPRLYHSLDSLQPSEMAPLVSAVVSDEELGDGQGVYAALLPLPPRSGLLSVLGDDCELRFLAPSERVVDRPGGEQWPGGVVVALRLVPWGGAAPPSSDGPGAGRLLGLRDSVVRSASDVERERRETLAVQSGGHAEQLLRPASSSPQIAALVETSAELEVGFTGVLKGIIEPSMGGVSKPIGDGISAAVGPAISKSVSPAIVTAVTDSLGNLLGDAIINPVNAELPMALAETVPDMLTAQLSAKVAVDFTKAVYTSVTSSVRAKIVGPTSDAITKTSQRTSPESIGDGLVLQLGTLVTHAASSALVGALTHVLTRTPLQDYYCFYCQRDRLYCAYCQNSPDRLYYSMYYANYFSTYYAQYFAAYFSTPGHRRWVGDMYPNAVPPAPDTWVPLPTAPTSPQRGLPAHGPPQISVLY